MQFAFVDDICTTEVMHAACAAENRHKETKVLYSRSRVTFGFRFAQEKFVIVLIWQENSLAV